jgi:chemotaxis protein methyltransferase CheR
MSDTGFSRFQMNDKDFRRLSDFIDRELGIKMPEAKKIMLESRLQKRLKVLGIHTYGDYCEYLFSAGGYTQESVHFFNAVTTNKTDFYREKSHFDFLTNELLPYYYGKGKRELLLWSCACSSGEEPYTIGMVLGEFKRAHPDFRYRVAASDISTRVLSEAADAVYNEQDVSVIPEDQLRRYFLRGKGEKSGQYRVKREIRDQIDYFQFNLMNESFSDVRGAFDIIFCRNVLIYFERKRQEEIIRKLVMKLVPHGFLFLGHSESMAGMGLDLKTVTTAVYQKTN